MVRLSEIELDTFAAFCAKLGYQKAGLGRGVLLPEGALTFVQGEQLNKQLPGERKAFYVFLVAAVLRH